MKLTTFVSLLAVDRWQGRRRCGPERPFKCSGFWSAVETRTFSDQQVSDTVSAACRQMTVCRPPCFILHRPALGIWTYGKLRGRRFFHPRNERLTEIQRVVIKSLHFRCRQWQRNCDLL